jgi:ABC-2 type transport system permease protein
MSREARREAAVTADVMQVAKPFSAGPARRRTFPKHLEKVRVLAAAEYKAKYAGSVLTYGWALAKPLALFSVLYLVFGRALRFGGNMDYYPLYLLLGVVVFSFFSDATNAAMTSLVSRASLLRRLAFPHLVIPVAITLTAAFTFGLNVAVVGVFVGAHWLPVGLDWLLLLPLLLELYVFVLAVGILLSALYVMLRDLRQIWELVVQVLLYATPIIYPIELLPEAARRLAFVSPLTQILQDVRAIILGRDEAPTVTEVFGSPVYRLLPLLVVAATCALAVWVFRRQEPTFAERV